MAPISGFSPILLPGPGAQGTGARNPADLFQQGQRSDPNRDQRSAQAQQARDTRQQTPESDVRRVEATERADRTTANTLRPENLQPDAARNQSSPFLAQFINQQVLPQDRSDRSNALNARTASRLYQETLEASDEEARTTFVGVDIVVDDEEADAEFFRDR